MASNMPVNDPRSTDTFSNALKVAQAAITASQQVYQAEERARYIEELAFKAHGEVRRLRNVAQSMVNTAVSVANMALDICSYKSYRHAFREHPEFQEIVPYEDFVNLIAGQGLRSNRECYVPDPPQSGWGLNNMNNRQFDWIDEGKYYNSRPSRNSYPDEERKLYPKHNHRAQDGQEVVLDTWESNEDMVEPLSHHTKVRSKQRPGSGRQYKPSSSSYNAEEENSVDKSKMRVDSSEKFPSSSPDEYRCHLATSFENTACIAPLWEDRYVDVKERESTSVQNSYTERWNEKKAMKQFQIKLQKAKLDDSVSAEDAPSHGSEVQPHTSSSATPEKHGGGPRFSSLVQQDRPGENKVKATATTPSKSDPETSKPGMHWGSVECNIIESTPPSQKQQLQDTHYPGTMVEKDGLNLTENLGLLRSPEKLENQGVMLNGGPETSAVDGTDKVRQFIPVEKAEKETAVVSTSPTRKPQERGSQNSYRAASNSSDSEVEEILKEPRVLRHLRQLEHHQPVTRLVPPKVTRQTRPISPLLNSSEKDHCSLSGEESPLSPSSTPPPLRYRQMYKPLPKSETHHETPE